MLKKFVFCPIFSLFRLNFTTERQKLRPFVSKYPPRFPTLKTVFCSFYKPENRAYHPYKTLFLQSRNPISTNLLALLAVVTMSFALRQKLYLERAKIHIISHTTKQLQLKNSIFYHPNLYQQRVNRCKNLSHFSTNWGNNQSKKYLHLRCKFCNRCYQQRYITLLFQICYRPVNGAITTTIYTAVRALYTAQQKLNLF